MSSDERAEHPEDRAAADRPLPGDALDELASAAVDGEASAAELERLAADEHLRDRRDELAEVASLVGAPVEPLGTADRDRMIAVALAAAGAPASDRHTDDGRSRASAGDPAAPGAAPIDLTQERARRRQRTLRIVATAAAAVAAVALAVPLLSSIEGRSGDEASTSLDRTTADSSGADGDASAAGEAESDEALDDLASEVGGGASLGELGDLGDLGDFATAGELTTVVLGSLPTERSSTEEDLAADSGAPATSAAPPATTVAPSAPSAEGATACDALAGTVDAAGTVASTGTARVGGEPVVVIVISPFDPSRGPTVVVATADCSTVLDQG